MSFFAGRHGTVSPRSVFVGFTLRETRPCGPSAARVRLFTRLSPSAALDANESRPFFVRLRLISYSRRTLPPTARSLALSAER